MESNRESPKRHHDSDKAEVQFNLLRRYIARIIDLPDYCAAIARDNDIKIDPEITALLANLHEACIILDKNIHSRDFERNYLNLKITLANVLKLINDTFCEILENESLGNGIDACEPNVIARRFSQNKRKYLVSRILALLLYDLQVDMSARRLPDKNELIKHIFGKYHLTKVRDKYESCYQIALALRAAHNKNRTLTAILDRLIKQLFDAAIILNLESPPTNEQSKIELERFDRLYQQCLDVYQGLEDVDRDTLGKVLRIQKLISDEFCISCGITQPAELSSSPRHSKSPRSRPESPRQIEESPKEKRPSMLERSGSLKRIPLLRSLSFKKSGSFSNLFQVSGKDANSLAERINNTPGQYHNARLLGLILGDFYRDKNAPKLREDDMQSAHNQAALLIEIPSQESSPELHERYSKLQFSTEPPSKNRNLNASK